MTTMKELYDREIARMAAAGDARAERAVRDSTSRQVAKLRNFFDHYGTAMGNPTDYLTDARGNTWVPGATVTVPASGQSTQIKGTTKVIVPAPAHNAVRYARWFGSNEPHVVHGIEGAQDSFKMVKREPIKADKIPESWLTGVFADNCACGAPSCGTALGCQDSAKETSTLSCQCGSGSNLTGPGHSGWCQCHSST